MSLGQRRQKPNFLNVRSGVPLGKVLRLSAVVKYKDKLNMGFVLKGLEKYLIFQKKLEREKSKCSLLSRGKK